jgi:hypothetical protein
VEPSPRLAYSPAELAELLGRSRAWVYLRLNDGSIPSVKLAGCRMIRAEAVAAVLDHLETGAPADG